MSAKVKPRAKRRNRRRLPDAPRPPSGAIAYQGPSALDGAPIVAILTGLARPPANRKIGDMVQLWILRGDQHPIEALSSGDDRAICGDCYHRGDPATGRKRSCYVNVGKPVAAIWKAYQAGSYADWTSGGAWALRERMDWAIRGGASRALRLGAYGDPAALPYDLLWALVSAAQAHGGRHTGYTHQWRGMSPEDARQYQAVLMASVDSLAEMRQAQAQGWRTFRVYASGDLDQGEALCPASEEADKRTTCERCALCGGGAVQARSVGIPAHGPGASNIGEGL